MINNIETISDLSIPPRIINSYSNFSLVATTSYYKIYEALSSSENKIHSIRVLDVNSDFFKRNRNIASTLFVQEILRLCTIVRQAGTIIIENFEIYEEKIAFVTKPYYPLFSPQTKNDKPKNLNPVDIEKMLKDTLADLGFIYVNMRKSDINSIKTKIFRFNDSENFFIGDWTTAPDCLDEDMESVGDGKKMKAQNNMSKQLPKSQERMELEQNKAFDEIASDIFKLGLAALELIGFEQEEWQELMRTKNQNHYNYILEGLLATLDKMRHTNTTHKMLQIMLQRDPESRINALEPHYIDNSAAIRCRSGCNTRKIHLKRRNHDNSGRLGSSALARSCLVFRGVESD